MTSFSRLCLFAVMVVSSCACLTETADAKWLPIFKCRQKPAEEAEAAPEPCPAPEPAPACCPAPAPEPEPAPAPVCCAEPAPQPVCEVEAPEPAPEPAAEPESPCCCCCCCEADLATAEPIPVADASPSEEVSDVAAQIEQYGMPELAEGETLVSISPLEVPTEEVSTLTVGPKE